MYCVGQSFQEKHSTTRTSHFKASEESGKAVSQLCTEQDKDKIKKNIPKYPLNTKKNPFNFRQLNSFSLQFQRH